MLRNRATASVAAIAVATATVLTLLAGPASAARLSCDAQAGNGDARIRKGAGNYKGAGVFSCTGDNQSVFKGVLRGQRLTADVRVKNDGNGPSLITMHADLEAPAVDHFKIKILKPNGKDVTGKAFAGNLKFRGVPEGASTPRLRIRVKARNNAEVGDSVSLSLWGIIGDNPPNTGDTVVASVSLPV